MSNLSTMTFIIFPEVYLFKKISKRSKISEPPPLSIQILFLFKRNLNCDNKRSNFTDVQTKMINLNLSSFLSIEFSSRTSGILSILYNFITFPKWGFINCEVFENTSSLNEKLFNIKRRWEENPRIRGKFYPSLLENFTLTAQMRTIKSKT